MSEVASSPDPALPPPSTAARLSGFADRIVDRLNPILVKEVRQAMKGRQFLSLFIILIAVAAMISVTAAAAAGADDGQGAYGRELFLWYMGVFGVLVLCFVPGAAFQGLSQELEEHAFELVAITTLTPYQVVFGKLLSTLVQTGLYAAALLPFIAFTYLLRGIDMPTILVLLGLMLLATFVLSLFGLFLGSMAWTRRARMSMGAVLALGLVFVSGMAIPVTFEIVEGRALQEIFRDFFSPESLLVMSFLLLLPLSYAAIFFVAAACRLSFESANRSTPVRIALAVQWVLWSAILLGVVALSGPGRSRGRVPSETILICYGLPLFLQWFLVGLFSATEPETISRRVFASYPKTALLRFLASIFFPGGARGFRFFFLGYSATLAVCVYALCRTDAAFGSLGSMYVDYWGSGRYLAAVVMLFCYGILYIGVPLAFCRLVLAKRSIRPAVIRVASLVTLMIGSIFPPIIALFLRASESDLRWVALPSPFWTIGQCLSYSRYSGNDPNAFVADVLMLTALTVAVVLLNMAHLSRGLKPVVQPDRERRDVER